MKSPLNVPAQEMIKANGYAIQCRVTTEDPANQFMPDTGKIMVYRSGGGFGVRLDAGNGFQGAVITPYYDSLLVKVSTWALSFENAAAKMLRNLQEFRIRGIKTNISFLENVVRHPTFLSGSTNTSFIDSSAELFVFPKKQDRGTKMLSFIADVTVNGFPGVDKKHKPIVKAPKLPDIKLSEKPKSGTKQILDEAGSEGLVKWIKEQKQVLYTDTTFRDAHQSLLATRMRTKDMKKIADYSSRLMPDLFSAEVWGGATFDSALRFLREDPWDRLKILREKMPNVLLQMLLRGSNAVGYKNYPDNLIKRFVKKASEAGIDVFRIFDSLNWLDGMRLAIEEVRNNNKVAEAAICYTGDILDKNKTKYDLAYYKDLAKNLEASGAHILAIKDMAGLLKPEAAYQLISSLKDTVSLPIHLHTHDTSGNGIYTYARAIEAGVDIVDIAVESMSGTTSQPNANALHYATEHSERKASADLEALESLSRYWGSVRSYYAPFESGLLTGNSEIYKYEMPGGQYSNLKQQASAVGLGDRFEEVKEMYRRVNLMFGDIVKVTPSSKVVGDMTLYMVQNDLTEEDIYDNGHSLDFPDSVISFFKGELGQPYQGFPKELQNIILKGKSPLEERPGTYLKPVDFIEIRETLTQKKIGDISDYDLLSYALYPKVFLEYRQFTETFGDVSVLDTPVFFYGLELGDEIGIEIEEGKTLIVKLVSIGEAQADGSRNVYFELNGQPREVIIIDRNVEKSADTRPKADKNNPAHLGASMPGTVLKVLVSKGEEVKKGDPVMITEAMKMETTLQSPVDGKVKDIFVIENDGIKNGDLLLELSH